MIHWLWFLAKNLSSCLAQRLSCAVFSNPQGSPSMNRSINWGKTLVPDFQKICDVNFFNFSFSQPKTPSEHITQPAARASSRFLKHRNNQSFRVTLPLSLLTMEMTNGLSWIPAWTTSLEETSVTYPQKSVLNISALQLLIQSLLIQGLYWKGVMLTSVSLFQSTVYSF